MQQLEIQYFYPLTEQIPLNLDYTKTIEYEEEKRKKLIQDSISYAISANGVSNFGAITLTTNAIDWENSTRLGNWEIENSKRKPGLLQKILMHKIFGMKWMGK